MQTKPSGNTTKSTPRYIMESIYHDNQYYHDIICAVKKPGNSHIAMTCNVISIP